MTNTQPFRDRIRGHETPLKIFALAVVVMAGISIKDAWTTPKFAEPLTQGERNAYEYRIHQLEQSKPSRLDCIKAAEKYSQEVYEEVLNTDVMPEKTEAWKREQAVKKAADRLDRIEQRLGKLEKSR